MICNPLDKCCEIVSSNCVAFIGQLPEGSTLCLADNSLTTFLLGADSSLTDLAKGSYILKSVLDNVNICTPKKIIDTADIPVKQKICNNKVIYEYYYTSDVVAQLVGNNCTLQTRLNLIYTEVNNPLKPQTKGKLTEDFMNFELPDSYIDKFRCLVCEEPCISDRVQTIGDLLDIFAKKILALQDRLEVSQGICKECY
jgi:hypothetical protein